jgi:hypothetical protein
VHVRTFHCSLFTLGRRSRAHYSSDDDCSEIKKAAARRQGKQQATMQGAV